MKSPNKSALEAPSFNRELSKQKDEENDTSHPEIKINETAEEEDELVTFGMDLT